MMLRRTGQVRLFFVRRSFFDEVSGMAVTASF